MERVRSVEIQARSLEEATRLALEQLGAKREDVDITVLAETYDDYYGDGEVLVRVSLRGSGSSAPLPPPEPGNERVPPPARDTRPSGYQDRGSQRGPRDGRGGPPRDGRPGGRDNRGRDSRGGPSRSRPGGQRSQPPRAPRPVPPRRPSTVSDEVLQGYETLAKQTIRELLDLMGVPSDVIAVDNPSMMPLDADDPPTVFIDVNGRDLGMLIGRRGEHLSQLQYMVNLLVNRQLDEWVRVIVDVEGYRTRREESLVGLAERVARQVARNRRPISLEPMPPNERRIVHMTLKELPDVRTESSGEGSLRRVTIYPS
jgi:spoIIIJ-associated protein